MFMASAAHDMKNSVAMLIGTLETLLINEEMKTAPVYQQMAHMLYETKRVNNNLIQLLALYREVGKPTYPFDPQSHAITQFVADIAAQNSILLESKNISLDFDYDADAVWCFDEDLILGVISHALNNAIHYTKDRVRFAVGLVDGSLEMRVEDNGNGYPPAMLEGGNRPRSGVRLNDNSTGLGLYFSREVAKMHQHRGRVGSVRLENGGAWGGGCFVLVLP